MKTSFNLPLLLELADKCPPICLHTESCVQGRFQREVPKSHICFPLLFNLKKKKHIKQIHQIIGFELQVLCLINKIVSSFKSKMNSI